MYPDLVTMTGRITRLRGEADSAPSTTLLSRVDDVLTEGYAQALAGDAWSIRAEQRLHELISDPRMVLRDGMLRSLSNEHDCCQRDLHELRRELAALRLRRDCLRERSRTLST